MFSSESFINYEVLWYGIMKIEDEGNEGFHGKVFLLLYKEYSVWIYNIQSSFI